MVNEVDGNTNLAYDSFEELRYIFEWSRNNRDYRQGDMVLIGGWAVHSFNPWKYSLDIDLIATGRFKDLLQRHLYWSRHYSRERNMDGSTIFLKSLDSGDIYLDFLPKIDLFHGTNKSLNLMEIGYETVPKYISYSFKSRFQVIVPEISMLLLLKLKAAWDRHYDLSLSTNHIRVHLQEKFAKDCGDIIALIQSDAFQYARFDWLSSMLSKFDFLQTFLEEGIIETYSTFDRISKKDGKALIKRLISLI